MRRVAGTLSLTALLIAAPPVIWLLWAQNEYSGLDSCPWDTHRGQPVVVGLLLLAPSVAIMAWRERTRGSLTAVGLAILTGVLAGVVTLVVAFFFGAGLRCTD